MKPDVPPSYESAVSREAWAIIAPWIPSSDLCSACLVSRKWYAIFVPFLWGDPASHFGIANDAVYVALTRFKRTLRKARLSVRSLTHTLHLPPALSEIYGGPNPTWLRDVLEYLPNLQSLVVTKLPFFDHHSLHALRHPAASRRFSNDEAAAAPLPTFGLKLLLASSEPNTTSSALAAALPRFPSLVYLDLSYTSPARDAAVLAQLAALHDLQVLKLRGVGLKDGEAEVLATAIGIRVRLLDVRDNLLTDMTVRSLLNACFLPPEAAPFSPLNVEDWPVGIAPGPDFFSLDTLRSEELDHELLKQLTNPLTGRLAFEDIPHRGLTHLYISGNRMSVAGLSGLLQSARLHILDGGSVDPVKTIVRTPSLASPTGHADHVRVAGAEELIPVLAQSARKTLTYLRVDHALITAALQEGPRDTAKPKAPSTELAGSQTLAAELPDDDRHVVEAPASAHFPVEMASGDPIFELDATPAQPRSELVGDMIYFALSPPVGDKPQDPAPNTEPTGPIRGEGPFAPEVVNDGDTQGDGVPEDHGTLTGSDVSDDTATRGTLRSLFSPVSPMTPRPGHHPLPPPSASRPGPGPGPALALTTQPPPAPPAAPSPAVSPAPVVPAAPPPQPPSVSLSPTPGPTQHRQARIETLLAKRPPGTAAKLSSTGSTLSNVTITDLTHLHPCLLPNLRTLVLTNVPTHIPKSSLILQNLKTFISACADEASLSHLLARTDYSLPPGRARHVAELEHARTLFALRAIVLEVEQPVSSPASGQRAWEHSRQRISMNKSSTGDLDSENLWSAAQNDFSFFGEEGEEQAECGIYQHDPEKYFPTAHSDDKILLGNGDTPTESGASSPNGSFFGYGTLSPSPVSYSLSSRTMRSPRDLPLGRNRRSSNESQRGSDPKSILAEISGGPVSPQFMHMHQRLHPPALRVAPTSNPANGDEEEDIIDLIAELAKWRKERKTAYEEERTRYKMSRTGPGGATGLKVPGHGVPGADSSGPRGYGYGFDDGAHPGSIAYQPAEGASTTSTTTKGAPPGTPGEVSDVDMKSVDGHWQGEIKVIRNSMPKGRTGVVDMYGNYFEKGYLYP